MSNQQFHEQLVNENKEMKALLRQMLWYDSGETWGNRCCRFCNGIGIGGDDCHKPDCVAVRLLGEKVAPIYRGKA